MACSLLCIRPICNYPRVWSGAPFLSTILVGLACPKIFSEPSCWEEIDLFFCAGNRTIHERIGNIGAYHGAWRSLLGKKTLVGFENEVKNPLCAICKELMYYRTKCSKQ